MTAPDTPVRVTLPGAQVSAEVTWEQVRAYLRAEGWRELRRVNADDAGSCYVWRVVGREEPGDPHVYVGAMRDESDGERLAISIQWLARLAGVAPGEMLARIAGSPGARVKCLDCGTKRKPGDPCPLCDEPDPSIPWRSRPESWIAPLVSLPDDVAANMFAAWLAQARAQVDAARIRALPLDGGG